jgi:hypothetical protein
VTKYHVYGTVDDDELLSLRFGDAAKEPMPKWVENRLCDVFWPGDMSVRLIETFSRGNRSVDFSMVVEDDGLHCWLWAAEADGWPLDHMHIADQLQLPAAPIVICDHVLQNVGGQVDNTPDA